MPNREENPVQKAIDGIEPSEGAKERMLANIRRKAAMAANETDPVQAEQEPVAEAQVTDKPDRKKSANRIIKLWLPAAAAVFVLLLGWGIYRNQIKPQKIDDQSTAGGEQKDRKDLSTLKEETSTEEAVRESAGEFPQAPKGAAAVKYFRYSGIAGGMVFSFEGHKFRLTVMSTETASEYFVPAEDNEIRESWERNGNEYVLVNSDGVDMTLWDIVIDGMKK